MKAPARTRATYAIYSTLTLITLALLLSRSHFKHAISTAARAPTPAPPLGAGTRALQPTDTCFNVSGTPLLREAQCARQQRFLSADNWFQMWKETTLPGSRYVEDPGVVYCAIAKNACTEYKRLFLRAKGHPKWQIFLDVHTPFRTYTRLDLQPDAQQLLLDPAMPKFVVVRNPILRTLSAFIDKQEQFRLAPDNRPETFRAWVAKQFGPANADPVYGAKCKLNMHWHPQVCRCGLLTAPLLYTQLKMENVQASIDFIYQVFPARLLDSGWGPNGVSWRDHFAPEEMPAHAKHSAERFLEYYDLETFDLLVERLQPDIDTLDYSAEVAEMRTLLEVQAQEYSRAIAISSELLLGDTEVSDHWVN